MATVADAALIYYGLPGHPVTLPCIGFEPIHNGSVHYIEWTKCLIGAKNESAVARSTYVGMGQHVTEYVRGMLSGRAEIDIKSADLCIHNFEILDEGIYRCYWPTQHSPLVRLKFYGLYTRCESEQFI